MSNMTISTESLDVIPTENVKIPVKAEEMLRSVNSWFFNIFDFNKETNTEPLKWMARHLFDCYSFCRKFKINPHVLNNFMFAMEIGYKKYNNPYHNNIHGADVAQTMNAILCETKLIGWLTDLEIFASLLAAIIHDYEHNGKTNGFLIATDSDRALIYNDRSVQENYHLSAAFLLVRKDKYNIFKNFSRDEYHEIRSLIVDLVLATDMAFHVQILKDVKTRLNLPELKMPKTKALALALHAADISSQVKKHPLNFNWADLIMEEFFAQGDIERELGLPISPICDRHNTSIPISQIKFLEFVVQPTFEMVSEMVYFILVDRPEIHSEPIRTPWTECCIENRKKWQEKIEEEKSAK